MQFKKTALVSLMALASTSYALDASQYASYQKDTLPDPSAYDGFIVYLKNDGNTNRMSVQSATDSLSSVSNLDVKTRLATGGIVVKSATNFGLFRTTENATNYVKNENVKLFEELKNHPDVALVEPNLRMTAYRTPTDPDYGNLWGLAETEFGFNMPKVWDEYTGDGVTVAVIDTGIVNHSDLNRNVTTGYDFISDSWAAQDGNGRDSNPADAGDWHYLNECDPRYPREFHSSSWHGSHVAGTIAMVADNGRGGVGVAYDATIVPVRVLGKCGGGTQDIADAIVWASGGAVPGVPTNRNPASVINMSLGGKHSCPATYQIAIDKAVRNGATVVVAAGNSNDDTRYYTPANCNNVVAVAALGPTGNRARYSNYGSTIDVSAPGGDRQVSDPDGMIYSTVDRGDRFPTGEGYAYYQGTSMATPHVAGAVALLKQKSPNLTPAQVEQRLKDTAKPIPGTCPQGCGDGMVDVLALLDIDSDDGNTSSDLTNGQSVTISSLARYEEKIFTVTVPAGATDLSIRTSGGTGDVDLTVQHEASSYRDCHRASNNNNETCTIATPRAGQYTVTVKAFSNSANINVIAEWTGTDPVDPVDPVSNTLVKYVQSGRSVLSDPFTVSSGKISGNLTYTSSYANLDLYLQRQSLFSGWQDVKSSRNSAGTPEALEYQVYVQGTYRWVIKSSYGSTVATLRYELP